MSLVRVRRAGECWTLLTGMVATVLTACCSRARLRRTVTDAQAPNRTFRTTGTNTVKSPFLKCRTSDIHRHAHSTDEAIAPCLSPPPSASASRLAHYAAACKWPRHRGPGVPDVSRIHSPFSGYPHKYVDWTTKHLEKSHFISAGDRACETTEDPYSHSCACRGPSGVYRRPYEPTYHAASH